MAEYGGTSVTAGTQYVASDQLGSARMLLDGAGNCQARMDYAPFGAIVPRTATCYTGSPASGNPLFTGTARDGDTTAGTETGLDHMGARAYWATLGRFTSPDAPLIDQDPSDPQSWNLYGYVRNNPLIYRDDDGHAMECTQDDGGNVHCTVTKPVEPPLDLNWFTGMFLRSLVTTAQVVQQAQRVVQPVVDWFSRPRNPTCMAGYTGVGASIGVWAGAGLGTLGLAGGPVAAATIPGGAAGGAAFGGGIGGLGGMIMCSSGTWGGSGGGRGDDYRQKTRGANSNDQKQINDAARQAGVDGRAFGRYVEKFKKLEGRGATENLI